jgi:hypothetical protein
MTRILALAILLLSLLALPAVAQETGPPRFLPSVWFMADLQTKRLMKEADPGTVIRMWTAPSTVKGGENLFGGMVGLRSLGVAWVWRFKDGGLAFGLGAVVETGALFDQEKPLKLRPAVTLSFSGNKSE